MNRRMTAIWIALLVSAARADAATLVALPYIQPGPSAAPDGPDSKHVIWIAEADRGPEESFSVEYGWEGSPPRTAAVKRTQIRLDAPTPEQLKRPAAEHRHDPTTTASAGPATRPLGEREQRYAKYVALLADLPRDSTVWYRVRSASAVLRDGQFRTRATPEKTTRFVAVGDLANGKAGQDAIAYQISLLKPDFAAVLGDIVYPTGRVSQYVDHFWRTYANAEAAGPTTGAPVMASVPFYALLGNHDVDTSLNAYPDCLGAYYFFHAPLNGPGLGKWNTPVGRDKEEAARFRAAAGDSYPGLAFYSFDEGSGHFLVLDNSGYVKLDSPEILRWIEQDLTRSTAKWKFVLCHAPAFHSSPAHYSEQKMRRLSPLLERLGVDVVFAGHVHNYQRSVPLKFEPAPPAPGDRLVSGRFTLDTKFDGVTHTRPAGIIHIVSGGGGGTLYRDPVAKTAEFMREKYGDNWAPYTAKHIVDRHSLVWCELTPRKLTLHAVDEHGTQIDSIVVTKE